MRGREGGGTKVTRKQADHIVFTFVPDNLYP